MSAKPLQLPRFTGGINLEDDVYTTNPDELAFSINFLLDPKGIPYKRGGYSGYGSGPAKVNGNAAGQFLSRFYRSSGVKELLAAANGVLYTGNDTTGAWTSIKSGMNTSNLFSGAIYKDYQYVADGTQPVRYDGTNLLNTGHFIHTSSGWTATPGSGGNLTASSTYQYILTSVQGVLGEGPASPAKAVNTGSSQGTVTLTNLDNASASYGATAKYLYRTKAGGSVFYFCAALSPSATSYVDTLADTGLGSQYVPVHAPRNDARYCFMGSDERMYWLGRAGANASVVEASDVGFPDRILDTDFFAVNNNDGDVLTGGCSIPGGNLFFKRNSLWLLRAYGYGLVKLANVGCVAPFSIAKVPGGAIWIGTNGYPCSFINGQMDTGELATGLRSRNVHGQFSGMAEATAYKVIACVHKRRYRVDYDPQGVSGYNSRYLTYDLVGKKWDGPHASTNSGAAYFSVFDESRDSGELAWIESRAASGSYVHVQRSTDRTDNGSKFTSTYRTGALAGREIKKFFRVLAAGKTDNATTLTARVITENGQSEAVLSQAVADIANPAKWDVGLWDQDVWAGSSAGLAGVTREMRGSLLPKSSGKLTQIEVTDSGSGYSVELEQMTLLGTGLPLK